MHVVEANGQTGVVSGWKVVPGAMTMYNLEVALDHTFVVGMGMWVVHNCASNDIKSWIQRSTYNDAVDTVGKDGVNRFTSAMKNGIVRAKNAQGIKWIGGAKPGFDYELKSLATQVSDWRFYGNYDADTQHIIFTAFDKALHK